MAPPPVRLNGATFVRNLSNHRIFFFDLGFAGIFNFIFVKIDSLRVLFLFQRTQIKNLVSMYGIVIVQNLRELNKFVLYN